MKGVVILCQQCQMLPSRYRLWFQLIRVLYLHHCTNYADLSLIYPSKGSPSNVRIRLHRAGSPIARLPRVSTAAVDTRRDHCRETGDCGSTPAERRRAACISQIGSQASETHALCCEKHFATCTILDHVSTPRNWPVVRTDICVDEA